MKTKKLLAALALPALFAACSQDEFVATQEVEFEGTPIGYLEFTATRSEADTRLNLSEGWQKNDKIGLGWISAGTDLVAGANLYSNHPLFFKANNGFKSETMVFEGLYIASFPYQDTKKVSPLVFDLSKQTYTSFETTYGKRINVSDKFVNLTGEAAGMGNATALTMTPLTNLMKLNIKLSEGVSAPEDFKVLGIKLESATSKLVNKLTLKSNDAGVVADEKTTKTAYWTGGNGAIAVQVGEKEVGTAIDATNGLDVYIELGALAADDDTKLTIETNYGDASIVTGSGNVTWYSKGLGVEEKDAVSVTDFESAVKGIAAKAKDDVSAKTYKAYGNNVAVNVKIDMTSIKMPSEVTCQDDLNKIVNLLEKLNMLVEGNTNIATIEFKKSTLKTTDGVAVNGDVVISDISGLNRLGGAVTFKKSSTDAPTNVYIAGELGLAAKPTINGVDFTVKNGTTLTVNKDLNLGGNSITVAAGGKLVNKAEMTVDGTGKNITISAGTTDIEKAVYEVDGGSITLENSATFVNNGVAHWIKGSLENVDGNIYADVATAVEMKRADEAFTNVGTGAKCEMIIATNLNVPGQLQKTTFANITKMTIKGNVEFGLNQAETFEFSGLEAINVESGKFSLSGGDDGTGENDFYTFKTKAGCKLTLSKDTELNIAAGAKLDMGDSAGAVEYNSATVNNEGWIAASSTAGTGTWEGNAVNKNPKKAN